MRIKFVCTQCYVSNRDKMKNGIAHNSWITHEWTNLTEVLAHLTRYSTHEVEAQTEYDVVEPDSDPDY